jgi:predicted CXXCH cytochrome family protein
VKSLNSDTARRARVRTVMGHPAFSVTIAISVALALTPFGPSQVVALAATTTPIAIAVPDPTATPTPTTAPTSTATPTTTSAPASAAASNPPSATSSATSTPGPVLGLTVDPGAAFGDHHVLARIEGSQLQANYLPVDQPVPDAAQFQTFRVRFRLHNAGTAPITETPRLEFRPELGAGFVVVPEKPKLGIPFYVSREWVPSLGVDGGTIEGPLGADIAVADLRIGKEGGLALIGHRSMGANPDRQITLPSSSYTEEEFTVRLSIDAKYLTGYELRITNGGTPLTGTDVAMIRLGAPPAVRLSPGQRHGVAVGAPTKTTAARAAYPLLSASVKLASATPVAAAPASSSPTALSYPLVTGTPSAATPPADPKDQIHGPYSMTTDKCAVCHRSHGGQAPKLLKKGSQSSLCFTCHNGSSSNTNVEAEYPVTLPANDPATREYFSHDALTPSNHTQSGLDEFGGVTNRHSECADCHNSHKATSTSTNGINPDSTQTVNGWTASGRLAGVSGVSVVNGAADAAPQYTLLSGVTDAATDDFPEPNAAGTSAAPITLEYQLCFKCHSGFTKLLPPIAGKPSTDALDKGIELNPANPSFHPVEAKGKNETAAMTASLIGTSPYKMWDFTVGSTIRCLNCHTSGGTPGPDPDPNLTTPAALVDGPLASHTSTNRGILLRPYRDRVLKSTTDPYSSGDFALCYVCHAEEPFAADGSASTKTNFSAHSQHLNLLSSKGDGLTSIDTPGDGQGNAICAECHFRIHSTTDKVGSQAINGSRLVNFAPNVEPNGGTLSWTAATTTTPGSCTLTCHGHTHTDAGQQYPALPAPLP